MTENETTYHRLRRRINPCETPGCSTNCTYAWSCHNTRLGKVGFFWPGIALMAALVGMVILQ
ncbi:MAG: hypothetical protein A3G73_04590 [Rhodospirillales bacterium RIFCSPLOWO2_12_FULL_67_15]|nr:MAG: hypothetical protein A3G73_04590 [Rhodospirillales bacterium RIFCSPLOWO2_12_FULL_67_15]